VALALQVMINESNVFLDFAKNSRKFIDGDIVKVYSPSPWANKVGNEWVPNNLPVASPRLGFIFVDNEPSATIVKYNRVLCKPREDVIGSVDKVRDWGFALGTMTTPNVDELLNQKYTTITWGQLKAFLKKKSEDRLLLDSDIV